MAQYGDCDRKGHHSNDEMSFCWYFAQVENLMGMSTSLYIRCSLVNYKTDSLSYMEYQTDIDSGIRYNHIDRSTPEHEAMDIIKTIYNALISDQPDDISYTYYMNMTKSSITLDDRLAQKPTNLEVNFADGLKLHSPLMDNRRVASRHSSSDWLSATVVFEGHPFADRLSAADTISKMVNTTTMAQWLSTAIETTAETVNFGISFTRPHNDGRAIPSFGYHDKSGDFTEFFTKDHKILNIAEIARMNNEIDLASVEAEHMANLLEGVDKTEAATAARYEINHATYTAIRSGIHRIQESYNALTETNNTHVRQGSGR